MADARASACGRGAHRRAACVGRHTVDYLQYVWYAYGVVVAYFYWTKTKHSNDSFFSQLLTWLLFALGFHAVTGIFNFLPPADRMVVLKLWVTITFVPYAIYVYYDEFDYKGRERKDELKEKKRKEREIRRDEKIKQARRERKKEMRALGSLS